MAILHKQVQKNKLIYQYIPYHSNMSRIFIESEFCLTWKEFPINLSIDQLCDRLHNLTGIEPIDMQIQYKSKNKPQITDLDKNIVDIDLTQIEKIIVIDINEDSMVNQLKNSTEKQSFKLSEEDYRKKQDSVLQWKKDKKLGRFDPTYQEKLEKERASQQQCVTNLKLDQRCIVKNQGMERRGWLRYIGEIPEINHDDIWCGIEFDEPMGKNDGSIKGKQYFGPVATNYGGFVKPVFVKTGPQYTPIDEFASSDEEI